MEMAMAKAKAAVFMGLVSTDGIRYDCAGLVLMLLCFGAFVRHLRKRDVADDVQNRRPEGFQMQDYKAEKREKENGSMTGYSAQRMVAMALYSLLRHFGLQFFLSECLSLSLPIPCLSPPRYVRVCVYTGTVFWKLNCRSRDGRNVKYCKGGKGSIPVSRFSCQGNGTVACCRIK